MNHTVWALLAWMLLQTTFPVGCAAVEPQGLHSDRAQVGHPEKDDTSQNLRDVRPLPRREGPPCEMPLGRIPPPGEREKSIPCRPGPSEPASSEAQDARPAQPGHNPSGTH